MDVKVRLKAKKRRGEDPRLDHLVGELEQEGAFKAEGRAEGSGAEDAVGVIAAGGLDVAKAHVTGLLPPTERDHVTFEMRKVVIEEEAQEKAPSEERSGGSGRWKAKQWRRVAWGAALVAVLSMGLLVGSWVQGRGVRDEGGSAAMATAVKESEAAVRAVAQGSSQASVPAVRGTGGMVECEEPGAAMSAANVMSAVCAPSVAAPRSTERAAGDGPRGQASGSLATPSVASASPSEGAPEKSASEINRSPEF